MKKAFLDQLFLGFILLTGIVTFIATVNDERVTRDKIYDLRSLITKSSQAMARSYERNMNMCLARTINVDILRETPLGRELISLNKNGDIDLDFDFYDLLPNNSDGSVGDGQPDTVITTVNGYKVDTFWYRFFDKDSFSIDSISWNENVNAPFTLTMNYGGGISANDNLVGTYQLDDNNCVTNTKVLLASQDPSSISVGDEIAKDIKSPPTYFFIIPDGGDSFSNAVQDDTITITPDHCDTSTTNTHSVKVGNTTKSNIETYFQHDKLNGDDSFVHVIPTNVWEIYNNYVEPGEGVRSTYDEFLEFCETQEFKDLIAPINNDNDSTNDIIDCITDINGQYEYGFEDWSRGDDDFNDVFLSATQFVISNEIDKYSVDKTTNKIVFDNDYCQQDLYNEPPVLTVTYCPITSPITINEDTTTNSINWTATDSDGTVESNSAITNNGTVSMNINGTITYTPNLNFFGEDEIYVRVTDDDSAVAMATCYVKVLEVNDPPTIEGTPATSVSINNDYKFIATASDVDGDVLTFDIQNLPSWATFTFDSDTNSATLTGTPTSSNVGTYSDIVITVSDGRGGSASLPAFPIEVVATNGAPTLVPPGIPDQTISVGDSYSYDISQHFTDPDGDTLTYSVKVVYKGVPISGFSMGTNGVITSGTVSKDYAGSVFTITVTASDGTDSVSDTFILEVSNVGFLHTFDTNTQNWKAYSSYVTWERYNNDGKLKIRAKENRTTAQAYFNFDFGSENAYKDLIIEFDMYYTGGWEGEGRNNQDYFAVAQDTTTLGGWEAPSNIKDTDGDNWYSFGDSSNNTYGPNHIKITTAKTDYQGKIKLQFAIWVTGTDEYIYIDNVNVRLK